MLLCLAAAAWGDVASCGHIVFGWRRRWDGWDAAVLRRVSSGSKVERWPGPKWCWSWLGVMMVVCNNRMAVWWRRGGGGEAKGWWLWSGWVVVSLGLLNASVKSTMQMMQTFKITHATSSTFRAGGLESICIWSTLTFWIIWLRRWCGALLSAARIKLGFWTHSNERGSRAHAPLPRPAPSNGESWNRLVIARSPRLMYRWYFSLNYYVTKNG